MKVKMKQNIKLAAADASLQKAVLHGMFEGCEVGTDIWEYIESAQLSKSATELCFGPGNRDPETVEEEREKWEKNIEFGAIYMGGHEAAELLIKAVRDAILNKL